MYLCTTLSFQRTLFLPILHDGNLARSRRTLDGLQASSSQTCRMVNSLSMLPLIVVCALAILRYREWSDAFACRTVKPAPAPRCV
jgi:hypothetical protein